ncbi:MAG: hypothetical protein ACXAAH_03920, partial [Promethearchaeota archaeon]
DELLDQIEAMEEKCDNEEKCQEEGDCDKCEAYTKIEDLSTKVEEIENKIEALMSEDEED